jgi:PAS domain S-box-containing protein
MTLLGKEQLLFECNPQPMWVFALDTLAFLAVNQAAISLYGYSQDEFLRMTTKDIRPAEDVPDLLKATYGGAEGFRDAGTWRHLTKDGTIIQVEITAHDIVWDGRSARLVVATNVTKRKQAEEDLRAERELLRTLIDNVPDLIYVKDSASRFVVANRTVTRFAGRASAEDLVGKTDFDFFPKDLATGYFADEQAIIRSGKPLVGRVEASVDSDGNSKWLSTSKVPLRDSGGQTIGIIGIGRDITERKQGEDKLRAERELLRTLIDNMPDYIYVKDTQGRFLIANSALATLIGAKSSGDLLGKSDLDFFPKELAASFHADEQAVIRSGEPLVCQEEPSVDAQGNAKWTLTSKVPLRDIHGRVIGIIGIGRDITERAKAEERLRLWSRVLDQSAEGIFICDAQERILLVNRAFEQVTGFSAKEAVGKTPRILQSGRQDRAFYANMWKSVLDAGTWHGEMWNRRKSGEFYVEWLSIGAVHDQKGLVTHHRPKEV